MPTVDYRGEETDCDRGDVLRDVLLAAGLSPHNGTADALNCRGHGSCGTCAVAVEGAVSDPTRRERLRLATPPHDGDSPLRLACQTRVLGDVTVEKFPGFWGQHVDDDSLGDDSLNDDSLDNDPLDDGESTADDRGSTADDGESTANDHDSGSAVD